MKSNQKESPDRSSVEIKKKYFHPLSLQALPPNRFTATVNRILSGQMTLLIQRIRDKG